MSVPHVGPIQQRDLQLTTFWHFLNQKIVRKIKREFKLLIRNPILVNNPYFFYTVFIDEINLLIIKQSDSLNWHLRLRFWVFDLNKKSVCRDINSKIFKKKVKMGNYVHKGYPDQNESCFYLRKSKICHEKYYEI